MFLDHYKYQCLNSALFLRQGHRSVRTADPARQRQAAVMALFLTGMINDGAHTANGPGETRFYQTEKEGRERESQTEADTEVWGEGELGLKPYVLVVGRTAHVSLSKAPSPCQLQLAVSVSTTDRSGERQP